MLTYRNKLNEKFLVLGEITKLQKQLTNIIKTHLEIKQTPALDKVLEDYKRLIEYKYYIELSRMEKESLDDYARNVAKSV